MSIFFNHLLEKDSEILNFSKEENQHIVKALRKKSKDKITVTNGRGLEWIGELEINNKNAFAKKISSRVHDELKSNIKVAIAPTKKNEKNEWFLEKLNEN